MLNPEQRAVLVESICTMPIKHERSLTYELDVVRNRTDVRRAMGLGLLYELAEIRGIALRDDSCPEPSPFRSKTEARMAMLFLVEEAYGE